MLIKHTRLLVTHFPECFRFYRDVLQLQPNWGDETDNYASFTDGQSDRGVLAIFRRQCMSEVLGTEDLPLDAPAQDPFMLIFGVEDVDAEVNRIRQMGVQFVKEPANYPDWGYRGAFLRDPDGNLVELMSELPPEQWSDELREADKKWSG